MTGHLLRRFHDHEIVPKSEVLLRSLGINPPSEEEVAAHKKREELKHPPSLMWQLAQMIGEQRLRHLLAISFMLAFAGFYFAYGANPITTVVHHAIGVTSGLFLAFVLWLS